MPASSSTMTSSHRLARSAPGTFVCGNSSTAQTCGRLVEDGVHVHLVERVAPVVDAPPGNHLQLFDLGDRVLPSVRLEVADDDVASLRPELLRLLEHPEGLPDARGVPQEHFQPAAPRRSVPRSGDRSFAREHPYVDSVRLQNQPLDHVRLEASLPAALEAVAHEDLGDAVSGGELEDRAGRVFALQDLDPCARLTSRAADSRPGSSDPPGSVPAAGRGPRRTLRGIGRPVGVRGGS